MDDSEITPLISTQISYYPQDSYVESDPDFSQYVQEAEAAILRGHYPERIKRGSSGSYFVLNLAGVCSLGSIAPLYSLIFNKFGLHLACEYVNPIAVCQLSL